MSGSAAATLAVEDSIFQSNALQIPPGTLEANVLLYTGSDGLPDVDDKACCASARCLIDATVGALHAATF